MTDKDRERLARFNEIKRNAVACHRRISVLGGPMRVAPFKRLKPAMQRSWSFASVPEARRLSQPLRSASY